MSPASLHGQDLKLLRAEDFRNCTGPVSPHQIKSHTLTTTDRASRKEHHPPKAKMHRTWNLTSPFPDEELKPREGRGLALGHTATRSSAGLAPRLNFLSKPKKDQAKAQ